MHQRDVIESFQKWEKTPTEMYDALWWVFEYGPKTKTG